MPLSFPGSHRSVSSIPGATPAAAVLFSSPLTPPPDPNPLSAAPLLNAELFDTAPFSESFAEFLDIEDVKAAPSGMRSSYEVLSASRGVSIKADNSYHVEQLSNIRDIDSEWEDDDIDEVMVLTPKVKTSTAISTVHTQKPARLTPTRRFSQPGCGPRHPSFTLLRTLHHSPRSISHLALSAPLPQTIFSPHENCEIKVLPTKYHPPPLLVIRTHSLPLTESVKREHAILNLLKEKKEAGVGNLYVQQMERAWEDLDACVVYTMFEYCEGGSLLDVLQEEGRVLDTRAKTWAGELAYGLSFLHGTEIVHRALRPGHIFVHLQGHIVISGFEHSAILRAEGATLSFGDCEGVTEWDSAPELLLGWDHGFQVDWWAYGVVLGWLACGQHPFLAPDEQVGNISPMKMRTSVLSDSGLSLSEHEINPHLQDLIHKCLERNPAKRISFQEVRQHEWFSDVDWNKIAGRGLAARSPDHPARQYPRPGHTRSQSGLFASAKCGSPSFPSIPALEFSTSTLTLQTCTASLSEHPSTAVLSQAQKKTLDAARPFSMSLSAPVLSSDSLGDALRTSSQLHIMNQDPASDARLFNPSPPSTLSASSSQIDQTETCIQRDARGLGIEVDFDFSVDVDVDEFGMWLPERSGTDIDTSRPRCDSDVLGAGTATFARGAQVSLSVVERDMCARAREDSCDGQEELSLRGALALPIPVLVTREGDDGAGKRKGRKLLKKNRAGSVGPTVASGQEEWDVEVPSIDWHGLDMDDKAGDRQSYISSVDAEGPSEIDAAEVTVTPSLKADKTFRWSALSSLSFNPPEGAHVQSPQLRKSKSAVGELRSSHVSPIAYPMPYSMAEQIHKLEKKSRKKGNVLVKKVRRTTSRLSLLSPGGASTDASHGKASALVKRGDMVGSLGLGAGVRRMGMGIGYTCVKAPLRACAAVGDAGADMIGCYGGFRRKAPELVDGVGGPKYVGDDAVLEITSGTYASRTTGTSLGDADIVGPAIMAGSL